MFRTSCTSSLSTLMINDTVTMSLITWARASVERDRHVVRALEYVTEWGCLRRRITRTATRPCPPQQPYLYAFTSCDHVVGDDLGHRSLSISKRCPHTIVVCTMENDNPPDVMAWARGQLEARKSHNRFTLSP